MIIIEMVIECVQNKQTNHEFLFDKPIFIKISPDLDDEQLYKKLLTEDQ